MVTHIVFWQLKENAEGALEERERRAYQGDA